MVTAHALRAHGGGDAEPRGDGVSRRRRRRALEIETSLSAYVVRSILILYCLHTHINIITKARD